MIEHPPTEFSAMTGDAQRAVIASTLDASATAASAGDYVVAADLVAAANHLQTGVV